jgi:hypothetical protein
LLFGKGKKALTTKILNVLIFKLFSWKMLGISVCSAFTKLKSGHVPLFDHKPMDSLSFDLRAS